MQSPLWLGWCAALAGLWALTLFLPALEPTGGRAFTGLDLLRQGWQGLRYGVVAWLANPMLAIALMLAALRIERAATLVSGTAAIVAATSFVAHATAVSAGAAVPEFAFGVGFYLWLAVMLGLFLTCLTASIRHRSMHNSP